jgi:hypothetical protein
VTGGGEQEDLSPSIPRAGAVEEGICATHPPLAPVQEKEVQAAAATEKAVAAPQKEKSAAAEEPAAAPPTAPGKVNPMEPFGSLFGDAKPNAAAAATPVAKATPIPKPAVPTPPRPPRRRKCRRRRASGGPNRDARKADGGGEANVAVKPNVKPTVARSHSPSPDK